MNRRPPPREKLAGSLAVLQGALQDGIYRAGQIPRRDFDRVLKAGYLTQILKGWYHVANPLAPTGTTVWPAHYWPFVQQYLSERFGDAYCLAAEPSLLLLAGLTMVPRQLVVLTERPDGNRIDLPQGCSLLAYKERAGLPEHVTMLKGLRAMPLEAALAKVPKSFFRDHPLEAASLLSTIRDPSTILRALLERGATVYAGRIAGAFRQIGYADFAARIVLAMRTAGFEVAESNPFDRQIPVLKRGRASSPYVPRLKLMWASMRESVIEAFPDPPGMPTDAQGYLSRTSELSTLDAYHSLSIEGYKVDRDLIERVRSNAFDARKSAHDQDHLNALAARGYYDASLAVNRSIRSILSGADPAETLRVDHHEWYRALFDVSVQAGFHRPSDLAGYRGHQVYINNSNHVPLPTDAVVDAMECLFDLLGEESHAAARAVLGHFVFVFIHPYGDGNGRMARFLMNALFASGGYPWTVVHIDARAPYMQALEQASTRGSIHDFADVIAREMVRTSQEKP